MTEHATSSTSRQDLVESLELVTRTIYMKMTLSSGPPGMLLNRTDMDVLGNAIDALDDYDVEHTGDE